MKKIIPILFFALVLFQSCENKTKETQKRITKEKDSLVEKDKINKEAENNNCQHEFCIRRAEMQNSTVVL